jgi:nucleotide-binding universal stress UspA family protein
MSAASPHRPYHVVVGYDRTESSRAAVTWAAERLVPDGKLIVVHATRALHAPPSPLESAEQRHELGRVLIDELLLEGPDCLFELEIASEVSDEDPASALIDAATRHDAAEIVVGHEQHSPLHKALGTVTSTLLDRSPVPVIAVPLTAVGTPDQVGTR